MAAQIIIGGGSINTKFARFLLFKVDLAPKLACMRNLSLHKRLIWNGGSTPANKRLTASHHLDPGIRGLCTYRTVAVEYEVVAFPP